MKKIKILFLLLLAGGGLSHASVQKTLFSADVVASACHVVVDADGTGSSRLTFGTYRKSSAAPVPPRDFTVRLYETGATVQGCSAFLAGQIATLNFGNPGQLDGQGVVTRGAGDGIRIDVRAAEVTRRRSWRYRRTTGGMCRCRWKWKVSAPVKKNGRAPRIT